jgi:hypothetical protein
VAGFTLAGCAQLGTQFGQEADEAFSAEGAERRRRMFTRMHQVPIIVPPLVPNTGNGVIFGQDAMGPNTGFHWSIRRLAATGWTAGTVIVYRNAIQTGFGANAALTGEQLFTFPTVGTYTFGRGEMLLEPDDSLLIACSGVTLAAGAGNIAVQGSADQFESWLLPDYLM